MAEQELAKQAAAAAAFAAAQHQQQQPAVPVAAVAVKLPPFWVDNAEVWFLQAEFTTIKVKKSKEKYPNHRVFVFKKKLVY
jgi:hypothetical protein